MHVELQIDDSIIMPGNSSKQFPAVPHVMHVYVEDVDRRLTEYCDWDPVILIDGEHLKILQGIYGQCNRE